MSSDLKSLKGHFVKEPNTSSLNPDPVVTHTMMELIDFFSDQPTFFESSQYLVLHVFKEFNSWGACIAVTSHQDRMQILGSFGLGEGLIRQYTSASCIGISLDQDIHINGAQPPNSEPQDHGPKNGSLCNALMLQGPNALGIISSHMVFVGFFQVFFLQPVNSPELKSKMEATLRVLRMIVPVQAQTHTPHLELHEQVSKNQHQIAHGPNSEWAIEGLILSSRQMEILDHMAEGKTNAAIARVIGFSESTVRQETIEIYRKLGVNDRRSAVVSAQSAGLIPHTLAISG